MRSGLDFIDYLVLFCFFYVFVGPIVEKLDKIIELLEKLIK